MMRISVIVPSYNSQETVAKCLQSIFNQQFSHDFEVFLVDSSIDRTPEIVEQKFPDVKLIKLTQKTDPGTARNVGAQSATGEILVFIDSDCIASSGWLENITTMHDADYAGVGGPVFNANKHSLIGWAGYLLEFSEWLSSTNSQTIRHIPSCNISYKRDIFKKTGGFRSLPLQPSGALQEDYIFNLYLEQAGYKILFDPEIKVAHFNRTNLLDFIRHQHDRGVSAYLIRQMFPVLGSNYLRYPLLSVGVVPARIAAIFSRILFHRPAYLVWFVISLPLLIIGASSWVTGFIKKSRQYDRQR